MKQYVESKGGVASQPERRWQEFVPPARLAAAAVGAARDGPAAALMDPTPAASPRAPSCARRSARSTSTCSISCCAAASIAAAACSMPAAATGGTCVYFLQPRLRLLRRRPRPGGRRAASGALAARARAGAARRSISSAGELDRLPWADGDHGRGDLQRGPAFRRRRGAFRPDGPRRCGACSRRTGCSSRGSRRTSGSRAAIGAGRAGGAPSRRLAIASSSTSRCCSSWTDAAWRPARSIRSRPPTSSSSAA